MVLLKTTLAGTALLLLGVLATTVLGQYVTMEVREVQRRDVEPHSEFLVGDFVEKSYSLPGGVSVLGTLEVKQAPTNRTGDMRFTTFDDENYQKWSAGKQADFAYSAAQEGRFNFTFTTEKAGVYHFIFDNKASLYKKFVAFSLGYNEVITSRVPDPRMQYVGWALLIVGAPLFIYGLVKRAPVTWA